MLLFFRPAITNIDRWDFWSVHSTDSVVGYHPGCTLSELHELQAQWPEAQRILLIPVAQVFCTTLVLTAQQYRQGRQGIPFMIEDWVSVDIEKLHVVSGTRNRQGKVVVLAMEKELLERMLEALAASGVVPELAMVDAQLIPVPADGQALFWQEDNQYLINMPLQAVAGCSSESLEFAQKQCQEMGLESRIQQADWSQRLTALTWSVLLRTGINMLQGAFAVKKDSFHLDKNAQSVLTLVAIACFMTFLNYFSLIVQERSETQHTVASITQAYQQIFPDEQRIVNLRLQIQTHLDALGTENNSLISVLDKLARTAQHSDMPPPQHLSYQANSGLDIEISTDANRINNWLHALQDAGLHPQLSSTSGQLQHVHFGNPL